MKWIKKIYDLRLSFLKVSQLYNKLNNVKILLTWSNIIKSHNFNYTIILLKYHYFIYFGINSIGYFG